MQPLTQEQFRDAIRKGLGRAVLHAREHGLAGLEQDVLHACLHSYVYVAMAESDRIAYLGFLLDEATDREFFRRAILGAVREMPPQNLQEDNADEPSDLNQILDLTLIYAQRGDAQAREVIYERFNRLQDKSYYLGAAQIISLDGVEGLLHVARRWGDAVEDVPEAWLSVSQAIDVAGRDVVVATLSAAAKQDSAVRRFWETMIAGGALRELPPSGRTTRRPDSPSLTQMLSFLESGNWRYWMGRARGFGRDAAQSDIDAIHARMLRETRPLQLLCYLSVFGVRELPRLDEKILKLGQTADAGLVPFEGSHVHLQSRAIAALSNTRDPLLRELAWQLLREQPSVIRRGGLQLLRRNYEPGDWTKIMEVAGGIHDRDDIHSCGQDLVDIAEDQDLPELDACMAWVYEHTPCVNCRRRAFEALVRWNRVPAEMAAEAQWDCDDGTRQLAIQHRGGTVDA